MGNIKEQKWVFAAQAIIKKTWEDMIAQAKVTNRDAPLEVYGKNSLHDATYSVTLLILYIY